MTNTIWTTLIFFAQGEAGGNSFIWSILTIWLPIGFVFYWLLIRPQQQERKQREAMLAQVKKNDKVVTVGGIYGVVTMVKREADEITIKVDEATNTKIRVTVGAVARVVIDKEAIANKNE